MILIGVIFVTMNGRQPKERDQPQMPSPDLPLAPRPDPFPAPESLATVPVSEEPEDPVRRQFLEIFRLLEADRKSEKAAASQADRSPGTSWIARLASAYFPDGHLHEEQDWNSPVNDEFVRRRFPPFDNPLILQKAGEDNYPTTHFVGVSGVGTDAAELPRTHPRAGIFSNSGMARHDEITDGLSNTILVAGVESQLGSWARPGRSTVRSFSREPYLHGPDGFGTGQPDRMLILMADGSVKVLNANTEPVIVRRMAAMADGISLGPHQPGDPLTLASTPKMEISPSSPVHGGQLSDAPILVELTPDVPIFEMKPRLAQKISAFETIRPVPYGQLLGDVQELMGILFDTSELPADLLERPVTISLQDTTAEEILHQLGTIAGTSYTILENKIRIIPAR